MRSWFGPGWCCPPLCKGDGCEHCRNQFSPESVLLEITGFQDDECADCDKVDGSYVLVRPGPEDPCNFFRSDNSSADRPPIRNFPDLGTPCTQATGFNLVVSIKPTNFPDYVLATIRSLRSGTQSVEQWRFYIDYENVDPNCMNWDETPMTFLDSSLTNSTGTPVSARTCDGSGATITLTTVT